MDPKHGTDFYIVNFNGRDENFNIAYSSEAINSNRMIVHKKGDFWIGRLTTHLQ